MSVQDDKAADRDRDQQTEQQSDGQPTEKPEPTEEDKKAAAEMMVAYDETRPTLVLPGSGGAVSGTAVNDWLDDDGNPKRNDGPAGESSSETSQDDRQEQIDKDKALNEELKKVAAEENKGEKR
ncbi:hypothetical protein [Mycobacterium sherrisii]|uniref:Uncharacterized protein n=1 Tax=Mycobacterium sherrisii TaxID=243061 RepID=A0A1E3SFP5_9MYCO|nr:hypothetical protein [Mycobacterium sherrisii]MCV7031423.1 hypothetical protein [Mycobacterium sherrisii]MEC4765323.1 hypothetical protein [Mycobacterium sherrisii]ODR00994.1 hypothetical protein BHQ21_23855 [Mycobacterium sherrisii]ORW71924.1 hypothetical protein AWC25_19605 [Mycobacterium sherrisii]